MRILALAIPCLIPVLAGCDSDSYPKDMTYPLRTDTIVVEPPTSTPFYPTAPGHLEANIATFGTEGVGGKVFNPNALPGKDRDDLRKALEDAFGRPADPRVKVDDSEAQAWVTELKLDEDSLRHGSSYYRRHCMHCHGVDGDGRGPTGPWVSPHPRDYRQGLFKFISTDNSVRSRKARLQDLRRTLEKGIEGTSMPSFSLLGEKDINYLVSYVIHLSLRGEVEMDTMTNILSNKGRSGLEGGNEDIKEHVQTQLASFLKAWHESEKVLEPGAYPYPPEQMEASVRRGYALFTDPKGAASCINCHLDYGRQVPFRYDKWGTLVRPADLTAGVYRGGRRPIDLYWRIRGGIRGAEMPKAEFETGAAGKGVDPYWDIVNFVQALPYPQMLPEDIRNKIYTPAGEAPSAHAQR
jgi:mono/diheme cytochrome c family protein